MKKTIFNEFYSWCVFNEAKQLDFNGHFWHRPDGNIVIDPIAATAADFKQMHQLGGVRLCVLTNADHERDAAKFKAEFSCDITIHEDDARSLKVAANRTLKHGEEVVSGMQVVSIKHAKTPGEIALWLPAYNALVVGDMYQGTPVGAISLVPDAKLTSPQLALAEARQLLRLPLEHLMVGDGHSIYYHAREAMVRCLESRSDFELHRLHPDEVGWLPTAYEGRYQHEYKELAKLMGARKLAFNLRRLPPGGASGPTHFHQAEEELFVVIDGECNLESDRGSVLLKTGDFLICPPGEAGAHTLVNHSQKPCILLCLSDVVAYDSAHMTGISEFRYDFATP